MLSSRKLLNSFLKRNRGQAKTYSKYQLTSRQIRQHFLDFFISENGHKFIRSSPIVPYCDPSVVFVNAGMNQFKNVFLGHTKAPCDKAANSQKCVRVGGKHNDLSIVGTDGYHHTFFEMLGNWSFGSYFKKEACEYAWNLLTGPYGIDRRRLYVTYFGGDTALNLGPDIECREIWRSLGVLETRILPFGVRDNFWEMGSTGPCGPCTEIHIDHLPVDVAVGAESERIKCVNAGFANLTELWNLVFVEYNRHADGHVTPLPRKHIDTGMGLERLVACLQSKASNYDTDLFAPIFQQIARVSGRPSYRDVYDSGDSLCDVATAYRTLADHSRMISACIADGMFPDQNHKLRRVLRKSLKLAANTFNCDHQLLQAIVPIIVEILGDTYPEMDRNSTQICQVIAYEADIFNTLMRNVSTDVKELLRNDTTIDELDAISFPGFIHGYKELKNAKLVPGTIMPGDLMFKLYDSYGLPMEIIEQFAQPAGLDLDRAGFDEQMAITRQRTKKVMADTSPDRVKIQLNLPATADHFKYLYEFNAAKRQYVVESVTAQILHLDEAQDDHSYIVIVDKSNFYPESGGQECDCGQIVGTECGTVFNVHNVTQRNGCIIHTGQFPDAQKQFIAGSTVRLDVDNRRRTANTLNHTATHLLNAAVKAAMNCVTYQKSSSVTHRQLRLELGVLGSEKIDGKHIASIEQRLRDAVRSATPVSVRTIDGYTLYAAHDITLIPGEIYPDTGLRIVSIDSDGLISSNEPCCGTHARNTGELLDICVTNVKSTGRGSYVFTVMTGVQAIAAQQNGKHMLADVERLQADFRASLQHNDKFGETLQQFRNRLCENEDTLPYVVRTKCLSALNQIERKMKEAFREGLREFIIVEMQTVLDQCPAITHPYIVHFLTSGRLLIDAPLQKVTGLCVDRPIMVLSISDTTIKARCCVPLHCVSADFDAHKWLSDVANVFRGAVCGTPIGSNPLECCTMKSKRMQISAFEELLEIALKRADDFARKYLDVPAAETPSSSLSSSS